MSRNLCTPYLTMMLMVVYSTASEGAIIVDARYTAGQGYVNGDLQFQQGWLGQNLTTVDTSGTGTASLAGATGFRRNVNAAGATGGTGGVASTAGFNPNDVLEITYDYQFTLSGNANINMAVAGIRDEGPNAGNGFDAAPQQGFKTSFNVFQASTGGSVKFFPDLNDNANGDALILDGFDLGIDPTDFLSGGVDLTSDRLRINYKASTDGANNWTVDNFSVTNLDTVTTFNYGGPTQTFSFAGTDAFVAQQLAPNGDAGFLSTTDGVVFEYEVNPPNVTTLLDTHFTSADGYNAGNLAFQEPNGSGNGIWLGQTSAQVDPTGTGTVTSTGGPFDRNLWSLGATGGTGGVPSTNGFNNGDQLLIEYEYQFDLPNGNTLPNLGTIGFRDEGPNAGNGFNASPQQGIKMEYNNFTQEFGGSIKFFPDVNTGGNANALIIDGFNAGIDPNNSLGNGVDLSSDTLRVTYLSTTDGAGNWTITSLDVYNVDTGSTFSYSGNALAFSYSSDDAFYAQLLAQNGNNSLAGTVDAVKYQYISAIPEPAALLLSIISSSLLVVCRRR